VPKTAFYFIRSATTRFIASVFPYRSRVSLKEAFAGLELCAGKLACTVLRGPDPSNGVECTPKLRHEVKGPITLNGGDQCLCPDNNTPVN
jgi:hypothetical protein